MGMSFGFSFAYMLLNISHYSVTQEYFTQPPPRAIVDPSSELGYAKRHFGHAHNHEELDEMVDEGVQDVIQMHDHKGMAYEHV